MRSFAFFIIAFNSLVFNGCDSFYFSTEKIYKKFEESNFKRKNKEIIVLTTPTEVSFHKTTGGHGGTDQVLLEQFAKTFGVKLKFKVLKNEDAVIEALDKRQGDLAAARWSLNIFKDKPYLIAGPSIEETQPAMFCKIKKGLKALADLKTERVLISPQVSFSKTMSDLKPFANLKIQKFEKWSTHQLVSTLLKGKVDCIVVDQWLGVAKLKAYSQFTRLHVFEEKISLHWIVSSSRPALGDLLHVWVRTAFRNDLFLSVLDHHRAPFLAIEKADVETFNKKRVSILPKYKDIFQNAGMLFNVPWELLAAISYQESKWNSEAVSYTGVKGLMQITKDTEKFLGLRSRQDPVESIWGGAKYIKYIYDQMEGVASEQDRLALSLAAYNMGLGHLRDAQKLVELRGKNSTSWKEVKAVLPLMSEPKITTALLFGAARGYEAMAYVERVRGFLYYLQN